MESIASSFSIDPEIIQKENEIYDPRDLSVGMRIFIPLKKAVVSKDRPTKPELGRGPIKMIWPSRGTISSGFGKRHGRMHKGIDITKDQGLDILAAASGIVTFAGKQSGYGKVIIIDHRKGVETVYAHNARLYVRKGARVGRGKKIAKMGSTGRSTGIHLHFEVKMNGKPVNPLRFLPVR